MILPAAAITQYGNFTHAQALASGWREAQLATAIRRGHLTRVRHGVYADADAFGNLKHGPRHLAILRAEQLALGVRWHAARLSAAVILGLPILEDIPVVPQLLADHRGRQTTSRNSHHRVGRLPLSDRGWIDGFSVTSPVRTAVDIARELTFPSAVVLTDGVLRQGYPRDDLRRCLAEARSNAGIIQARRVIEFADGLSESALESISRVAIAELQLPVPELQTEVWVGSTQVARVDFLWRGTNTIGESDGRTKYGETEADRKEAFWIEKRRQDRLEDLGFEVVRWTWDVAMNPRGVLDRRLLRAFSRGVRQTLDPAVRLVRTTVTEQHRAA